MGRARDPCRVGIAPEWIQLRSAYVLNRNVPQVPLRQFFFKRGSNGNVLLFISNDVPGDVDR